MWVNSSCDNFDNCEAVSLCKWWAHAHDSNTEWRSWNTCALRGWRQTHGHTHTHTHPDRRTDTESYALDGMSQTTHCAGCVLKQLFTVSHSAAQIQKWVALVTWTSGLLVCVCVCVCACACVCVHMVMCEYVHINVFESTYLKTRWSDELKVISCHNCPQT